MSNRVLCMPYTSYVVVVYRVLERPKDGKEKEKKKEVELEEDDEVEAKWYGRRKEAQKFRNVNAWVHFISFFCVYDDL